MSQKTIKVVAALVCKNEDILLVQQKGPQDLMPTWALPGGVVEPGELLIEALQRELLEETGLSVTPPTPLVYHTIYDEPDKDFHSLAFVFKIEAWSGELRPNDPDKLILDLRFFPRAEAIRRLADLPWRTMREPLIAFLEGEVRLGSTWRYQALPDGGVDLVEFLAG